MQDRHEADSAMRVSGVPLSITASLQCHIRRQLHSTDERKDADVRARGSIHVQFQLSGQRSASQRRYWLNSSIQNDMNNVQGEGYAVGTGTGAKSLTLGTSDGAVSNAAALNKDANGNVVYDTFIATTSDSSNKISSQMTMRFINGFVINDTVSFDFEIFPDGTSGSKSGQSPRF